MSLLKNPFFGGKNTGSEEGEEITEIVKEGDIIYLCPAVSPLYLHGDDCTGRVGFQSSKGDIVPENFDDCLWRIVPQLSYVQAKEYKTLKKAQSGKENELFLSKEREEAEQMANLETIKKVSEGKGGLVTYGQVVQLMHLKSGKWLTNHKAAALIDRDALKLSIASKGSKASGFIIKPSIKVRSEGGQVYYNDSIELMSTKMKSYALHVSSQPYSMTDPEPRVHEANILPNAPPLKILKFARYTKLEFTPLRAGLPMRMYHHEAESYLQASSNAQKNLKHEALTSDKHRLPGKHLPYLKRVLDGDYESVKSFSGKAVWVIEYVSRAQGGEIKWNSTIRLRHVPSRKYLAVDYVGQIPMPDDGESRAVDENALEKQFGTLLVAETELEGLKIQPEQLLFVVRKVEDQGGALVSLGSNIRIEHQVNIKVMEKADRNARSRSNSVARGLNPNVPPNWLYLGWTQQPKVKVRPDKDPNPMSSTLAFTTVRKDQDAFQIVEIEEENILAIEKMLGYRNVAEKYVRKLQFSAKAPKGSNDKITSSSQLTAEYQMLKELIFQIVIGDQTEDDKPEIIQGPSNKFHQIFGRDCKLMDALMEMVKAPEALGISLVFDVDRNQFGQDFEPLSQIHSLTCKALMHLFLDFPENENYFARQGVRAQNWINILIGQVASPVGASDTLTNLISNNADLLEKNVDTETINTFKGLIGKQGPVASYLRYFTGICSCRNSQILSNQESMLKDLYLLSKSREQLLIEHISFEEEDSVQFWTSRSDELAKEAGQIVDHGEFLGKEEYHSGFKQVYIYWLGNSTWKAGQEQLFYSPEALGLKTRSQLVSGRKMSAEAGQLLSENPPSQERLVRIEDLCWVLDPEKLKKKVQGPNSEDWIPFEKLNEEEMAERAHQKRIFDNMKKLALYLEAEIDLFAEMSLDRSYNVIEELRIQFPYTMLISLVHNDKLPDQIRASYAKLLLRLYMDCFPHEKNCGRHQFPDLVWVFNELKRTRVRDPDALPRFQLLESHPMFNDSDEFYGFRTSNKFHLMEDFISDFFIDLGGCQVMEDPEKSIFTKNILHVLKNLLSFGFYATYEEIKDVCNPMIATLDGRADKKFQDGDPRAIGEKVDPTDRYHQEENTALVMDCKQSICEALLQVTNLSANYSLQTVLFNFRQHIERSREQGMADNIASVKLLPETRVQQSEEVALFNQVFTSEDASALDLDAMSDSPLDTVLLDLLMYESNTLFDASLKLLNQRHTKKHALLGYLQRVKLVPSQKIPVYQKFEQLDLEISMLRNHMQSSEKWGVSNSFSALDKRTFDEVYSLMDNAIQFILMDELDADMDRESDIDESKNEGYLSRQGSSFRQKLIALKDRPVNFYNQDLLFYLGLHEVLLTAVGIKFEDMSSGNDNGPDKTYTLKNVVSYAIGCLTLLVKCNKPVQEAVFGHMESFASLFVDFPELGVANLIIEVLRGNGSLCEKTDERLFCDFANELNKTKDTDLMEFFFCQIVPEGDVIAANQKKTMSVLLNPQLKNIVDLTGLVEKHDSEQAQAFQSTGGNTSYDEARAQYQTALLRAFIECGKGQNTAAVGKLQKLIPSDDIVAAICRLIEEKRNNLFDDGPCNLLEAMVCFLDNIFFDTALQEPKNVSDGTIHDMLGQLAQILDELDLNKDMEDGATFKLGLTITHCLKNYLLTVQSYTTLHLNRELYDALSAPLTSMLEKTNTPHVLGQIAYETLLELKFDEKEEDALKPYSDFFSPKSVEQGETFFPGQLGPEEETGPSIQNMKPQTSSKRQTLQIQLQNFVKAMTENKEIQEDIVQEKMALVDLLENSEVLTDPDHPEYLNINKSTQRAMPDVKRTAAVEYPPIVQQLLRQSANEKRTNKVTFDDLVSRMRSFVKDSIGNPDMEPTCCLIFELLKLHLYRARLKYEKSEDSGNFKEMMAKKTAKKLYSQKQTKLSELGIVDVVYEAISSDADSNLGVAALELGFELLNEGNKSVQNNIVKYAKKHDANGRFFKNLRDIVRESTIDIKAARKVRNHKKVGGNLPTSSCEAAEGVFGFLKELCEGHFAPMQDILREQTFNRKSFDLVSEVVDFLAMLGKNQMVLRYMQDQEYKLLISGLDTLIEMVQGPCSENQKIIADSKAIDVCIKVLSNEELRRLDDVFMGYEAKVKALLLIASCLEGRKDVIVHKKLAKKMEPGLLDRVTMDLDRVLKRMLRGKGQFSVGCLCRKGLSLIDDSARKEGKLEKALKELSADDIDDKIVEYVDNACLSLFSIRKKLAGFGNLQNMPREPLKVLNNMELFNAFQILNSRLGSIEVSWQGKTEVMLFPIPVQADSLTETTKAEFMASVDYSTQEARLKGLLSVAPRMRDEMKVLYGLQSSKLYMFVKRNELEIKYWNFFMAVCLNMLSLFTLTGSSIFHARTLASQIFLIAFVIILALGYLTIIVFFTVSQYQLVWREMKRDYRDNRGKPVKFTTWRPVRKILIQLLGYIIVCFVHSLGFAEIRADFFEGYVIFGFIIFGTLTLKALRSTVVIPQGGFQRFWVCSYDVFTTVKVASHTCLLAFTLLGFYKAFFFPFILFDIISLSEDLKNTIRAIVTPIKSLGLTALLFVVVILVFSTMGFEFYGGENFCEDSCEEDDFTSPATPLDSFWLVLNAGTRYGDIGEVMTFITHDDSFYYNRIFFMLAFFIILGVLLFDMVTGIILDTFSSLREETAERNLNSLNECFISGVTREMYDEMNLPFEMLKKRDQNLWSYVNFMLYLDLKDESEFNGGEGYVWQCILNEDTSWFPTRTSFELEQLRENIDEEETVEEQIKKLQESTDAQFAILSRQMADIMKILKK